MASACELMCQPSAKSAMELNHQPAPISTTIMAAVIHITRRVLRSAAALPAPKWWSCCQALRSWVCMGFSSGAEQVRAVGAARGRHHAQVAVGRERGDAMYSALI
eukprot:Opistho-1_new@18131